MRRLRRPVRTPSDAAKHESEQPAATAPERKVPGGIYEYHSDKWAELYGKRVDEMIAALKSKGVPVLWVGLPAIRGARSTSDMSYLDELYRAGAEKSGITYVDVWDGSSTTKVISPLRGRTLRAKLAAFAPLTASTSPRPARRNSLTMSNMNCAG